MAPGTAEANRSTETDKLRHSRTLHWTIWVVLALASVHFARCYVSLTGYWIHLNTYAAGLEKMPFQGRMLMMYPLRWAEHSSAVVQLSEHHAGALQSPDLIVVSITALLCLVGTGLLVVHMYRRISQVRAFPWLPYALLVLIAFFNYILHVEQNFLYPYDLPSLFFFTLGIWLIYTRRFWWLLLLFPIATLNRETTIFLVPLLLLDAACSDGERLQWRKLLAPAPWLKAALLVALWEPIELYVHHRFHNNPTDLGSHFQVNIVYLVHPQYWPQLFSMGAFLPLFIAVLHRDIPDARLRAYCWIFLIWIAVMLYYGMLVETRIFGELSGLLALVSALLLERLALDPARDTGVRSQ